LNTILHPDLLQQVDINRSPGILSFGQDGAAEYLLHREESKSCSPTRRRISLPNEFHSRASQLSLTSNFSAYDDTQEVICFVYKHPNGSFEFDTD
jgi:hypothetical protein